MSLADVIRLRIASLGKPCIYGLPIGHVKDKLTIPIGVTATLDVDRGMLRIEEPAVG